MSTQRSQQEHRLSDRMRGRVASLLLPEIRGAEAKDFAATADAVLAWVLRDGADAALLRVTALERLLRGWNASFDRLPDIMARADEIVAWRLADPLPVEWRPPAYREQEILP